MKEQNKASATASERNDPNKNWAMYNPDKANPQPQGKKAQPRKPDAATHSPLPWQTDFAIQATFDDGSREETVIEIMTSDHSDTPCYATSKADAKLIVASVNHAVKLAAKLLDLANIATHPKATLEQRKVIAREAREAVVAWEGAQQ